MNESNVITLRFCFHTTCYKIAQAEVAVYFIWLACCYSFTGTVELSNGSKWIRSNVSYYGAVRAKVIKLFILMDVDTQTHTTTHACAPAPLPTPLTTHLSRLQSIQTHLLTRRAGRKEVNIWGVEATCRRGRDPPLPVGWLQVFLQHCSQLVSWSFPTGCNASLQSLVDSFTAG